MVTSTPQGGIVFTMKLDQASVKNIFGGAFGSSPGAGTTVPFGGQITIGQGQSPQQQQQQTKQYRQTQQQNFLKSLLIFEAIKKLTGQAVSNSSAANTMLGSMGKVFGSVLDVLLLPFMPIFNLIMVGVSKLVQWLITSGTLKDMSNVMKNLADKITTFIDWIRQFIANFKVNPGDATKHAVGDIFNIPGSVAHNLIGGHGFSGAGFGVDIKHAAELYGYSSLLNMIPGLGKVAGFPFRATNRLAGGAARGGFNLIKRLFGRGGGGGGGDGGPSTPADNVPGAGGPVEDIDSLLRGAGVDIGMLLPPGLFSSSFYKSTRSGNIGSIITSALGVSRAGRPNPNDPRNRFWNWAGNETSNFGSMVHGWFGGGGPQTPSVPSTTNQNSGNTINMTVNNYQVKDPNTFTRDLNNAVKAQTGYSMATGSMGSGGSTYTKPQPAFSRYGR